MPTCYVVFEKHYRSITSITKLPFGKRGAPLCHMRQPAFIESMTCFKFENGAQVRFWAELPAINAGRQEFIDSLIDGFKKSLPAEPQFSSDELALSLMQFHESITAVEVVNKQGNGVVLYAQWP
jgi:hypothetical protein